MKTQFLGPAYQTRSPILASQTAINIYPQLMEIASDNVGGFYGTPGLDSVYTGAGEVRGLWQAKGVLYAVIGSTVYRFDNAYTATNLGNLPSSSGKVSIADNGLQIVFAHHLGWHYVDLGGTAIASVTGAPANSVVVAQDNYLAFTNEDGTFGITGLGDATSINPLDVATPEGSPDGLISIISDHRELWLFGEETTEIWTNTGAAFFPFERAPGGFMEQGCAAKWTPAKVGGNSVMWLGRDKAGQNIVFQSNGYVPVRVSTHAIEYEISKYSTVEDAFAYAYQQEGHYFYVLTFPTGNATWVYDISTRMWHQRAYLDDGNLIRHRSNCHALFNGKHIVGDYENGKLYEMSLDVYTDDGDPIYRERAWETPDNEHKKVRIDSVELIALTGDGEADSAPIVTLQVSQDAGRNWGYERDTTLGLIGVYKARARWRRIGSGRDTVLRVKTTMNGRVSWVGANIDAEALGT
jgi:hypothetical protein